MNSNASPAAAIGIVCALIVSVVGGIVWFVGSENFSTPAGYVGYVTRGAVFGKTSYVGLQTGPTSTGRGWLLGGVNISVTPTKVSEGFAQGSEVLSSDGLKLTFQIHTLFRVRPAQVNVLVEKYSTLHESDKHNIAEVAFDQFIKEPLRTHARARVEVYKAREVPLHFTEMGTELTRWAVEYTKDSPFEVMSVVVGNLQYPPEVADAVSKKLAAQQVLEQQTTEVDIERKKAEKRVVEAEGLAKATQIIQSKLTPLYIQHEAIDAQKQMANSPNHTIIYIPVGKGGVPLVSTVPGVNVVE